MDLFLDGWDDVDESAWADEGGGYTFPYPNGTHTVTITKAAVKDGTAKTTGNKWVALVLTVTHPTHGELKNQYVFAPTPATWGKADEGLRAAIKREWKAIGIRPDKITDEQARAAIIGREVNLIVADSKKNKDEKFIRFRPVAPQGSGSLPTAEQRQQETSVASTGTGVTL